MNRVKDLTGQRFSRLIVIRQYFGFRRLKRAMWQCKCDCGNEVLAYSHSLLRNTKKSCGCLRKENARVHFENLGKESVIDLTGKEFGRLTVLERADTTKDNQIRWKCQCQCGKEKLIRGSGLRCGRTLSCGCLNREINSIRSLGNEFGKKHGLSNHPLRSIRKSMIHRCYNPNNKHYATYGQKGVKVCAEWLNSLSIFIEWAQKNGWTKGLSIDRKDNDGDYTPENCHWITRSENSRKNILRLWKEDKWGRRKKR